MLASSASQRLLVLVLVSLLAAIGIVLLANRDAGDSQPITNTRSKFDGPTMPPGLRAKNFRLTDQNGRHVTVAAHRGQVVILTFIHSRCKDDCPFMIEQIKGALNDLPGSGRGVPAIGVSVAPAEDTASSRRRFLAQHRMSGRIAFVNGRGSAMRRVWHDYAMQPGTGANGHSAFVLLIDKRGIERVGFAASQLTPEGLAHDIRVLEAEPA
jgi:protein SCO1